MPLLMLHGEKGDKFVSIMGLDWGTELLLVNRGLVVLNRAV